MQGQKSPLELQLFVYADPYTELPRHGFYAAMEKHIDLSWVREATTGLYADGVGRPSLDPVVFIKLMLVAYFENLVGDSELAFRIADSLTVRRFLGYSLEESTPERTCILKTRQRWPVEVFEAIFARVLEQLQRAGLVKGEKLGTDTVLIDANASLDNLRHRELGCSYAEFVKAFYAQNSQPPSASEIAAKDAARPNKANNQEWVSSTDPEAAVAVHPDGHTALSYRLDATVDLDTGAIVQIGAAPGNVRDSVDLPQRVAEAKENLAQLDIEPEALTADRGHHSAENLVEVEEAGVTPIIRQRQVRGKPGFRQEDFVYLAEADAWQCPAGELLPRRGAPQAGRLRYKADGQSCCKCAHFGICTTSAKGRVISVPTRQQELERNRQRVRSPEGRELLGKHRQRAEAPWSYAKLYGGLALMRTRGLLNAWKKALLQGIGWNIMKLIARLTGLTPRGKSALTKTAVTATLSGNDFSTAMRHFFAGVVKSYVFAIFLHVRIGLQSRLPMLDGFLRKTLFSQGC